MAKETRHVPLLQPVKGIKMRTALYARVSTEEQARKGYSIEAQLVAMRSFGSQKGWSVSE